MAGALTLKFAADIGPAKNALSTLSSVAVQNFGVISAAGRALSADLAKTSTSFRVLNLALEAQNSPLNAMISGLRGVGAMLYQHRVALGLLAGAWLAYRAVAGGAVDYARERLAGYIAIAEKAKALDVGTTFFQGFTQIAGSADQAVNRVDLLTKALQNAKGVFDGLRGNKASAEDQIVALANTDGSRVDRDNAAALAFDRTENTEQKTRRAIKLMDELIAAGNRFAALDIAEGIFGRDAARELFSRIDQTKKSLAELFAESEGSKSIISPEQIARAEEMKKRLDEASNTLATAMKPLMADIESLGVAIAAGWDNITIALKGAVAKAAELYTLARGIVVAVAQAGNAAANALFGEKDRADKIRSQLNTPSAALVPLPEWVKGPIGPPAPLPPNTPLIGPIPPERPKDVAKGGGRSRSGGGSGSDLDETDRLIKALEKKIALQKVEIELEGKSNEEKEKARALATLSSEATDAQRAKIAALASEHGRLKDAIEAAKKSQEAFREAMSDLGNAMSTAFKSAIFDGQKLDEVLKNLLKNLASKGIDKLFDSLFAVGGGGSGGGGIIGSIFKGFSPGGLSGLPARGGGGPVMAGQPYLIGERGPEIMVPGTSGTVLPNSTLRGGNVTIVQHIAANGDATIARMVQAAAQGAISQFDARLPSRLAQIEMRR